MCEDPVWSLMIKSNKYWSTQKAHWTEKRHENQAQTPYSGEIIDVEQNHILYHVLNFLIYISRFQLKIFFEIMFLHALKTSEQTDRFLLKLPTN